VGNVLIVFAGGAKGDCGCDAVGVRHNAVNVEAVVMIWVWVGPATHITHDRDDIIAGDKSERL
jgi:hypothetical protein